MADFRNKNQGKLENPLTISNIELYLTHTTKKSWRHTEINHQQFHSKFFQYF